VGCCEALNHCISLVRRDLRHLRGHHATGSSERYQRHLRERRMESTRMDPDLRMQMEVEDTRFAIERLTEIFADLTHGGLRIPQSEFVVGVQSIDNKLRFAMLGLHFVDPLNFYKSLDVDQNGEVGIDEFVMGCLRLKSGAIFMDMDVSVQEMAVWTKKSLKEQRLIINNLQSSLNNVCSKLSESPR